MSTIPQYPIESHKKQPINYVYVVVVWTYSRAELGNAYPNFKTAKQSLFDSFTADCQPLPDYEWIRKTRDYHRVYELRIWSVQYKQILDLYGYVARLPLIGGSHD